jgi:uncharacterized surface protein with fasciclin (FAS1) repeats
MLAALTFTACSDKWDDHYTDEPLAGTHAGTLWQALTENPQLSNFTRVAQACGFANALSSSQTFTIFAPTNAQFTSYQADSVIALYKSEISSGVRTAENRAIREFLQNHIARYIYSVSPVTNDSIIMMNGKYIVLTNNKFGGKDVISGNSLYGNGVLFTLGEPVDFYNNIFEYLRTDDDLDSVRAFMYDSHYYRYYLDEELSVPGELVDGKTTYLDSVMVKYNELFYTLGQINTEDSSYWMVVPNNSEWKRLVEEYTPYFNYHDQVDKRDSLVWAMPRLAITLGTVFSTNINPLLNKYLVDKSTKVDSVRSTNAVTYNNRKYMWGSDTLHYYEYMEPFAEGRVFDGVEYIRCSNGFVLKTDQWNIDKRETFMQDIIVEAESASFVIDEETTNKNVKSIRVQSDNPYYGQVSNNQYLEVSPKSPVTNPVISFDIPSVLSNVGYDIYLITVPAEAGDTLAAESECMPVVFYAQRFYKEQDGSGINVKDIKSTDYSTISNPKYSLGEYDGLQGAGRAHVVDTICLGKNIVFPTCSWNMDVPQVQVRLQSNVLTFPPFSEMYTQTLRIDCIIFKPHVEATDEEE